MLIRRIGGRALLVGAMLPALGVLAFLGVDAARSRDELWASTQRSVRAAELRGALTYLDEWLTMSAEMAALSGEHRWIERYESARPKLDAVLDEALSLTGPEERVALRRTVGEAHADLDTMVAAALREAEAGDRASAQALLDGPEFAYLKSVYASGLEAFGRDLTILADERVQRLNSRTWAELAALACGTALLIAAAFILRVRQRLHAARARTERAVRTDALTGLTNRLGFFEALSALRAAGLAGSSYAVLMMNLDRFRAVNDAHGRAVGDDLLRAVAARLRATAPEQLAARLDGDAFAMLARLGRDADEASRMAMQLQSALARPFQLAGAASVQVGVSIGIAVVDARDGENVDTAEQAQIALLQAKSEGRGRIRFFEPGMDSAVRSRAALGNRLRKAIASEAIVPHYQPLFDVGSFRLVGFEMLARWPDPARGFVSPAEFIPIAENLGLIGELTSSLMRRACAAAASWPSHVTVACNVSPIQLQDRSIVDMIRATLHETGLPAHRLELEITESALVADIDLARTVLDDLKSMGVRLALDDFGTGYSSLRHLQALPFDKLKIDASFVGAMTSEPESHKIVAAVIGLGHSLGMSVVAEGIETDEVASMLRDLRCDIGQGWFYGRPASADATWGLFRPQGALTPA